MALTADQVQKFYIGYYARPADPVGLTYWQTQDEAAALKGFSESAEFTSQFTGLSASQQVTKVYNNLLGRAPDTAGLLYWAGELTAGRETIGTLVLSMIKNALGKDVTTIEDRVTYSNSFTAALDTPAEINAYAGAAATQTARTALLKVVANSVGDHTALNAEVKNIDTTVATIVSGGSGGGTPGQNFALTEKIGESVVGTAGNDTFKAVFATGVASDSTLNLGDSIDGGAGTDTLNLILTSAGTGAIASGVTIKNVEVVNLDVTAPTAADASFLKSSAYEGVTQLWQVQTDSVGTAGAASFGGVTVAEGVTVGFRGNNVAQSASSDTAGAADVSATVTAAAATQKSLSIALDGVGSRSVVEVKAATGGKIETVNVSGSVAKDTSTASGLLKVNTTGDTLTVNGEFTSGVALTITGAATKLKTVDLSKSTGGVDIDASGLTASLETIKGGAGHDKLTVDLGVKLVTVDLGAGNDTLTFADATTGDNKELSVTLGAGKDTVVGGATIGNVQDLTDLAKGLVTVADFKIGEDTINLSSKGVVLTAAQLDTAKNAGSLKAAIDSVAAVIPANKSAVFSYGTDAYVFINGSTAGFAAGDGLIKLVGVDATLLSTDQNGGLVL